jgi:hypothetical protein
MAVVLAVLATGCGGLPSDAGPGGDLLHPDRPIASPRDDVLVHVTRYDDGETAGRELEVLKEGSYDAGTHTVSGMDRTSGGRVSPAGLAQLRQALEALGTAPPPSSSPPSAEDSPGTVLYVIAYNGRFISTHQTDKPAVVQRVFAALPPGLDPGSDAAALGYGCGRGAVRGCTTGVRVPGGAGQAVGAGDDPSARGTRIRGHAGPVDAARPGSACGRSDRPAGTGGVAG